MQLALDFTAPPPVRVVSGGISPVVPPAVPSAAAPSSALPVRAAPGHAEAGRAARARRGLTGHLGGLAAENSVARCYARAGLQVLRRRYRGPHGEIDLVLRDGPVLVFVEVKRGRSHDGALHRISRRQVDRIRASAAVFADTEAGAPGAEMRFDLATVDAAGAVRLHPGILSHF